MLEPKSEYKQDIFCLLFKKNKKFPNLRHPGEIRAGGQHDLGIDVIIHFINLLVVLFFSILFFFFFFVFSFFF